MDDRISIEYINEKVERIKEIQQIRKDTRNSNLSVGDCAALSVREAEFLLNLIKENKR